MRTYHIVLAAIAVIVAGAAVLLNVFPPPEPQDFAQHAVAVMKSKLPPGVDIATVNSNTLDIQRAGKTRMRVSLENIQHNCAAKPPSCDAELGHFADTMAAFLKNNLVPHSAKMLRIAVRSSDYLQVATGMGENAPVSAPIAPGLIMICMFDLPDSVVSAGVSELRKLGLTPGEAMSRCKANTLAALPPPVSEVQPLDLHTLGMLRDGYYTASQFAFPERWEPVNKRLGGKLIVVVVGTDLMLYGRDDSEMDVGAMREAATRAAQFSTKPISTDVYRWTKTGWEIVP